MPARSNQHLSPDWRKSSASVGDKECVEAAALGRSVLVRDSRNRPGPSLAFNRSEWRVLLVRIRNGEFDQPDI
jgi:hypothetical protein